MIEPQAVFKTHKYDSWMNKEDSYRLKGIAIIMMVSMHLMKTEWIKYHEMLWDVEINGHYLSYLITQSIHSSTAIFAFISGYAWGGGKIGNSTKRLEKIISIYVSYWVATLFVNLPCLLLNGTLHINGIGDIILCLAAVSSKLSTYCWYVAFFGAAVITFPIFKIIIDNWNLNICINIILIIVFFYGIRVGVKILSHLGFYNSIMGNFLSDYCATMPIVLIGYIVRQSDLFGYINYRFKHMRKETIAIFLFSAISIIRGYLVIVLNFKSNLEALWIIIEIYSLVIVSRKICAVKCIDMLLKWLGAHSLYIWLIHSIFGYAHIQKFTYILHVPLMIIIMVMAISALIAIPVNYLDKKIQNIKMVDNRWNTS